MTRNNDLTNAELAILTLLAEQPRHGYDIEQVIEGRGMREWTQIGFSSIYYLLKKLERKGWIKSQDQAQVGQGPSRKIFNLTQEGLERTQRGVLETLSTPTRCMPAIQIGLANLPAVDPKAAEAALQEYHQKLVDRLNRLETKWQDQQPLPDHVDAMFEYSLTLLEAERLWVESFLERLKS
jgi:DNA-binding PadR family transcriptional regulator